MSPVLFCLRFFIHLFCRAALIPPQNLLQAILHRPLYTMRPLQTRIVSSGLRVLHTPMYTRTAFAAHLSEMLGLGGPKTAGEIPCEEGVTVGLAAEMIGGLEGDGMVWGRRALRLRRREVEVLEGLGRLDGGIMYSWLMCGMGRRNVRDA